MKPTTETEETITVAVPVADLELIATVLEAYGSDEALELTRSHIPKPKPRLVAFDIDDWLSSATKVDFKAYIEAKPDLLTLLDREIDQAWRVASPRDLKARIRTALGVTE